MKIKNIPIGTDVYNIELVPEAGGKLVRSAGASAKVMGIEGKYVHIKMPSGEFRKIHQECLFLWERFRVQSIDMLNLEARAEKALRDKTHC